MNETTTLPSRKKKSPSEAILGNGKPARKKAGAHSGEGFS